MNLFGGKKKQDALDPLRAHDRYKLLGFVGKGKRADISTCFDSYLNRIVAHKRLREEHVPNEAAAQAFLNETKLISYLDHPGVVSIYDVFLENDAEPCYTMKLIKGATLRSELSSKTRGQLLQIFVKLCETLAYVHDKGVVHLDLNLDNIMIGQYGEVLITDWGSALLYDERPYREYLKLVRDAPPPPINPEQSILLPSKSTYLSPEQIAGDREALTPSSDVFSMGIILYEMMSGRVPFAADTQESLAKAIRETEPHPLHAVCPEVPRALSQMCTTMLQKDPFHRYHSFHEVLIDVDAFHNSGQAFSTRTLKPGEVICAEGHPGDFAFVVLSGAVEVSRTVEGQRKVLARLGPNEIVGELAVFTGEPRSATVIAAEPGTTIRIMGRDSVEQELGKLSPWIGQMITGLSRRFMRLNDDLLHR